MLNIFATVSDYLSKLFAQTSSPNWVLGSASAFNNSLMPIVNPVQDFQSYRWRNNEIRAFEEKSLPLGNLASWTPVWTERAWNLLDRVWPSLFGILKELSADRALLFARWQFLLNPYPRMAAEVDWMFSTQSSISSSCLTRDVDLEGARDNASAVVSSLPGTWEIVTLYRAFVPSSILGGERMPVVLLMMYASFAASICLLGI